MAVTVALGGIAGSGRARGVRRPSGVAGLGVRTLHGAGGRGRPAHGCPSRPQEQFEFALTAVAEEVNAILQALPQ